jgi:hypothetical protein
MGLSTLVCEHGEMKTETVLYTCTKFYLPQLNLGGESKHENSLLQYDPR